MPTAIIDYKGREVEYDFPQGMNEDEIVANFQSDFAKYQIDGRNRLRAGVEFKGERTKRGRRIEYSKQELIDRNLPAALGVGAQDVDTRNGIPALQRSILSALQDDKSRFAYLSQEYGKENVEVINFNGKEEFVVQGKDKKWRMTDPKGVLEFSDFTTDIAGEVIPVGAGIIAGGATALSGFGILGTATAANLAEATVGSAQDAFVRFIAGLEINPLEIGQRRAINATVGFGAEVLTMGAVQRVPKLFVARSGVDQATESAKFLNQQTGKKLPTQMYLGEQSLNRIQEIAERYPNSPTAKLFEDIRTQIGQRVEGDVGLANVSEVGSNAVLQENLSRIAQRQSDELNRLSTRLEGIGQNKEATKALKITSQKEATVRQAAKDLFSQEKQRKAKDLVARNEIPTTAAGQEFQRDLLKQFLRVDAQKTKLYNDAYSLIGDVSVSGDDIASAYSSIVSIGADQFDDDLVKILGDVAAKKGLRSAEELSELGDVDVPFGVVNELIQSVSRKAKFGTMGAGPEAVKFQKLNTKLSDIRDSMLEGNPEAKAAFEKAQNFYRQQYLRFDDGVTKKALALPRGQNLSEARQAFVENPTNIPAPRFNNDGLQVVRSALQSPGAAREMIEMSSDPMGARMALRQLWLQRQGLVADGGLERSAFKLSDDQKEMVRMLWPQKTASGENLKIKTFASMEKFMAGEGEYVEGMTRETLQGLFKSNTEMVEASLEKLAKEEKILSDKVKTIQQSVIQKMVKKGALDGTVEDNIKVLMSTVDKLSVPEIREVKRLLSKESKFSEDMLINSTVAHILRRANRGMDDAQLGKYGFQLWNPEKLENLLVNNEAKYSVLLGNEKYKLLRDWNDGLKRVSVTRPTKEQMELRANVATSGRGGATGYLSGVTDWARNVWTSAMLTASLRAPKNKVIMDARSYDDLMKYTMNLSAITAPGIGALAQQAEDDPEIANMVTATFTGLMADMREAQMMKAELERSRNQRQQEGQPTQQGAQPTQ